MLTLTNYTADTSLFQDASSSLSKNVNKITINQPTGDFFYDPWVLKDEYKNTPWEALLNTLPVQVGEARIIILDPTICYRIHADIDDRYHLNILGDHSYLIDLENNEMHEQIQNGCWYLMDASCKHTAANFGRTSRIQLVVRQLLTHNKLIDPVSVNIKPKIKDLNYARFVFDNTISSWLNVANKNKFIDNFVYGDIVKFDVEKLAMASLKETLPEEFVIA
jgi:hypothetical protein